MPCCFKADSPLHGGSFLHPSSRVGIEHLINTAAQQTAEIDNLIGIWRAEWDFAASQIPLANFIAVNLQQASELRLIDRVPRELREFIFRKSRKFHERIRQFLNSTHDFSLAGSMGGDEFLVCVIMLIPDELDTVHLFVAT